MDARLTYAIAALVIITALISLPVARRFARVMLATAFAVGSIVAAISGFAILMNNVSVTESPGLRARIARFFIVNWAATSEKGLGSKECEVIAPAGPSRAPAGGQPERKAAVPSAPPPALSAPAPALSPSAAAATARSEEEDYYPELVQRGYPGIPRARLFKLARETINKLDGWKILDEDSRNFTFDCLYTTRIFRFEDHVRIYATPRAEISICSRSWNPGQEPDFLELLFTGDLAANIGHIKEFYTALEPLADAYYKEQEKKQNGRSG